MLMKTVAILAAITTPVAALAQEAYPDGTIEVVTHSGAGGGTDTTARMMIASVAPVLGTDMVIASRQGGSGAVSMEYLERQPADGHTILVWTTGHAVTQAKNGATAPRI